MTQFLLSGCFTRHCLRILLSVTCNSCILVIYFHVNYNVFFVVNCILQVGEANFANWAHQAIDFILGTSCHSIDYAFHLTHASLE